jgi:hypothetical protein
VHEGKYGREISMNASTLKLILAAALTTASLSLPVAAAAGTPPTAPSHPSAHRIDATPAATSHPTAHGIAVDASAPALSPTPTTTTVSDDGIDWGDAALGAAAGSLIALLGVAVMRSRRPATLRS